jgi:hypothetical protein
MVTRYVFFAVRTEFLNNAMETVHVEIFQRTWGSNVFSAFYVQQLVHMLNEYSEILRLSLTDE